MHRVRCRLLRLRSDVSFEPLQRVEQPFLPDRLYEIIDGIQLKCPYGIFVVSRKTSEYHLNARTVFQQTFGQFNSVHLREFDIQKYDIDTLLLHRFPAFQRIDVFPDNLQDPVLFN